MDFDAMTGSDCLPRLRGRRIPLLVWFAPDRPQCAREGEAHDQLVIREKEPLQPPYRSDTDRDLAGEAIARRGGGNSPGDGVVGEVECGEAHGEGEPREEQELEGVGGEDAGAEHGETAAAERREGGRVCGGPGIGLAAPAGSHVEKTCVS
jgi:hypothetical protein